MIKREMIKLFGSCVMDIPSTSGKYIIQIIFLVKNNNTFDGSHVSSVNEPLSDLGSSYNPSDIEESSSEKSRGKNENVLVTDEKRGACQKFVDKSQWQRNTYKKKIIK
ncbi:unnamed protein product [Diabrotica balteata]|uniref:Uncharacterized protein n=1 Tax=Diabrotica balteata TaxID=107213 RepID=A0A9N9T5Y5_DIABA|nr:unnamed protein product [Diabrotica balteata]